MNGSMIVLLIGLRWIGTILFAVWIVMTLNGVRSSLQRIADSVENYARDRMSHP